MFNHLKKIPPSIWMLGIIDGIINISATIIFSLSGPFMKEILCVKPTTMGIVEGMVELLSWSIRLFSGIMSDYLKKRKAMIVVGYTFSLLSRPFFALAGNISVFSLGRILDRLGKGLQASPREALVAESSPENLKGTCFGLRHALGISGSVLGSFIVLYLMKKTQCNYRFVFGLSAPPILLAIFLLIFLIKDKPQANNAQNPPITLGSYTQLGKQYWYLILFSIVLMLGRSSEVFMTLHALELGMPLEWVTTIMLVYNISEAMTSYSAGNWFDHANKRLGAMLAVVSLSLANLALGSVTSPWTIISGCILWGFQRAICHSILLALVAHTASPHLLGTAYGVFYIVNGLALFLTNTLSGLLVSYTGYSCMYLVHAALGVLAFPFAWLISIAPTSSCKDFPKPLK